MTLTQEESKILYNLLDNVYNRFGKPDKKKEPCTVYKSDLFKQFNIPEKLKHPFFKELEKNFIIVNKNPTIQKNYFGDDLIKKAILGNEKNSFRKESRRTNNTTLIQDDTIIILPGEPFGEESIGYNEYMVDQLKKELPKKVVGLYDKHHVKNPFQTGPWPTEEFQPEVTDALKTYSFENIRNTYTYTHDHSKGFVVTQEGIYFPEAPPLKKNQEEKTF